MHHQLAITDHPLRGVTPLLLCVAALLYAVPAAAQTPLPNLAPNCDSNVNTAERIQLIEAYQFVYENRFEVWDYVDRTVAAGNPFNYIPVSATDRADWRDKLDDIVIYCRSNADLYCASNPARLGYQPDISSTDIHMCMPNIRTAVAATAPTVPNSLRLEAVLANNIAHETFHIIDGPGGHPAGDTDGNPLSGARVVGAAMEHLAVTPELRPEVTSVVTTATPTGWQVDMDVRIVDDNPWALLPGTGVNGIPAAQTLPVSQTNVAAGALSFCFQQGGNLLDARAILYPSVLDLASQPLSFTIDAADWSPSDPGTVTVDCNGLVFERNEQDNSVAGELDLQVDLLLEDLEILSVTDHLNTYRYEPAGKSGVYDWRTVEYGFSIRHYDGPCIDSLEWRKVYEYWFTKVPAPVTVDTTIGGLCAGDSHFVITSIDFRIPEKNKPYPADLILFQADPAGIWDHDPWNNHHNFVVDAGYFRPDYTVDISAAWIDAQGGHVDVLVRNIGAGPPNSTTDPDITVDFGNETVIDRIAPLLPGEARTMAFDLPNVPLILGQSFALQVESDSSDLLDEVDEQNNIASDVVIPGS